MLTKIEMEICMDAISEAIITKLLAAILEAKCPVNRRELIEELFRFKEASAIHLPKVGDPTYRVSLY